MKNYKITCPSIFITVIIANHLSKFNDFHNNIIEELQYSDKTISCSSRLTLNELYNHFAGTPFDIVIQELDDDGNLVRQK